MARRRLSKEEKRELVLLGTHDPGKVLELCREYGVSRSSFYRWCRETYFGPEDMEDSVQDFLIVNCMSLPVRVENCLRQVLLRLPPRAAMTFLHNPYILVIYVDSVSVLAYRIVCRAHRQVLDYWFPIVTLTQAIETMSDEALVGAIAHELAHVVLKHAAPPLRCRDREKYVRELERREEGADNLAKKWGFRREIEASQQWGHSQAAGAG